MSDTITFNTEDAVSSGTYTQKVKLFDLVSENDLILRKKLDQFDFSNPPVDPIEFASSLVETCKNKGGFGLSSNQCGYTHRVFVMGQGDEFVAMFNPKILQSSEKESSVFEGCLSFPMLALKITRPNEIFVEYQDFNGIIRQCNFQGLTSHIFQHELDHLDGICYTDRAKTMSLKMGMKKRAKFNNLVKRYNNVQKKLSGVNK